MSRVSKGELKEKTQHDEQIVDLSAEYANEKEAFWARYGAQILGVVTGEDPRLGDLWTTDEKVR